MRFGIRFGPFWVSTSTRRRRRRSQSARPAESFHAIVLDEDGRAHPCQHNHRTREAAKDCERRQDRKRDEAERAADRRRTGNSIASMTPEQYRRHLAEINPEYGEQLRRREAEVNAEVDAALRKMKGES